MPPSATTTPAAPPFRHWIITNRKVVRSAGPTSREVVDDSVHLPSPIFRVGSFSPPPPGGAKATADALAKRVEFAPDADHPDYADLTTATKPASVEASKRMFLDLYQQMDAWPKDRRKGDTLLFLHGFNYSWNDALLHLQSLHEVYAAPPESPIGQILYFTWPSYGSQNYYPSDQAIAMPSGQLLGRVFAKALSFYEEFFGKSRGKGRPDFCGRKIHLAAHSMGNQVLEELMRVIRGHEFLHRAILGEVLLLNADADWDALEPHRPLSILPELAERVHVYNHEGDDALLISETTKNEKKRLGRHGPRDLHPPMMPPRTLIVDCSRLAGDYAVSTPNPADDPLYNAAVRALSPELAARDAAVAKSVLSVTGGGGPRRSISTRERLFDHWGYLHRPEVIADLYHVLSSQSSSRIPRREKRDGPLYRLRAV